MRYATFKPEGLEHLLQCFWILEHTPSTIPDHLERVFPDGYIDLFFHYGSPFQRYDRHYQPIGKNIRLGICGPFERSIFLKHSGPLGLIGARFVPGVVSQVLPISAASIANRFLNVADIIDGGAHLEKRLGSAQNNQERLLLLQQFLRSRLQPKHSPSSHTQDLLHHIRARKGIVNIATFASHRGISIRALQRQFKHEVGLPPKRYAGLIRFRNVVRVAKQNRHVSYTTLAHEFGYFDQAHFVHDFRKFSGVAPRSFFNESHCISEMVNGLNEST